MYRILSWLLHYPEPDLLEQTARAVMGPAAADDAAAPDSVAPRAHDAARDEAVEQFLAWAGSRPLVDLQAAYTNTFDFSGEHSLHLTYHLLGNLRDRGRALAELKLRYGEAGYLIEGGELPDYLPLLLEFAAEAPTPGVALLQEFRAPIEVLHRRLVQAENPYGLLLRALSRSLPAPGPDVEADVGRMLLAPPPDETSGIDPETAAAPIVPAAGPSCGRSVAPW